MPHIQLLDHLKFAASLPGPLNRLYVCLAHPLCSPTACIYRVTTDQLLCGHW